MSKNKNVSRRMIRRILLPFLPLLTVLAGIAQEAGPAAVSIEATEGMQYDMVRFRVNPGSKVTLTLTNASDMSHNLVIAKPGTRLEVVKAGLALAEKGPQMNYIPKTGSVLWSIPVVLPGQNKSLTFTAPEKPGVYPHDQRISRIAGMPAPGGCALPGTEVLWI
jgi:azurin